MPPSNKDNLLPIPEFPELQKLERREIPPLPQSQQGLRSVPAWAVSLLFHVSVIVLLGLIWVGKPKGTGAEADRPVGVAVVYEAAGKQEYYLSGNSDSDSEGQNAASEALLSETSAAGAAEFTESSLQDLLGGPTSAGGDAAAAAGTLGLGDGAGALGGSTDIPKVKTSVFGIEGEGTRFLYVFDRSDSMNGYGGSPLRSAKSELTKSLDSLSPVHQFQIIFYNDTPLPYGGLSGGGPKLFNGEKPMKEAARRFVRDIGAVGGTQHIDALKMALGLGPDVVFFLTDADAGLPPREVENIQVRASRSGTTIHTIQFGSGPKQNRGGWIEVLAVGTGGKYRYVDVTKLSD